MNARSRFRPWHCCAAVVVALVCAAAAAQTVLESVRLRHQPAEQVAAKLQAMLGEGEAVIPARDELLLNVLPSNLERYRTAIAALDMPLRQWLIEVRQGEERTLASGGLAVQGDVTISNRGAGGVVIVGAGASRQQGSRILSQSLRVLDGTMASISLGNAAPLRLMRWVPDAQGGGMLAESDVMIEAQSGFSVAPQAMPDGRHVQLALAPRLAQRQGAAIDASSAQSAVVAPVGDWVTVAATSAARQSGPTASAQRLVVQVRVTEAP